MFEQQPVQPKLSRRRYAV